MISISDFSFVNNALEIFRSSDERFFPRKLLICGELCKHVKIPFIKLCVPIDENENFEC